jgi:shikimate kinase
MADNIFLVGLMGAGKTTIGRMLAKHLHKTFYDSDHEIERRTGVKIPLIFEVEGESGFRKRETAVIDELVHKENIVLATGGGAVLAERNRANLKAHGLVIYLRANVQELWQRTRNDKNRPLLQGQDGHAKLQQLFVERDPLYTEIATHTIETEGESVSSIISRIEHLIRNTKIDANTSS